MLCCPVTEYDLSTVDPAAYALIDRPAQVWVSDHVNGALQCGTAPTVTLADAGGSAQDVTAADETTTAGDAGSYRRQFHLGSKHRIPINRQFSGERQTLGELRGCITVRSCRPFESQESEKATRDDKPTLRFTGTH